MFKTLINAWNVKDIRTKMLYTLLLVVIYRFGSFIPVPGVDASKIAAAADTYSILSFLNLLSGGNFGQFTIFAMGITPYITGSIIIQLLTIAIPSLEKMAKEEDGREKLERITRYTGIGLALVQSIGIVSGLLVVFGVWFLDYVLRVDDPVGAVAVHCLNGIWGTIAVGLFATTSAPGNDDLVGLFYGGGFTLLGKQLIGFAAVASWTVVTITITFLVIRAGVGLRVTEEEEIVGLDAMEHGLASAYSGFSIMDVSNTMMMDVNENTNLGTDDYKAASDAQKNAAVKVVKAPAAADTGMYKVVIISKLSRYDKLRKAMNDLGVTGMTVTQVMGCGVQKGAGEKYRGVEIDATLLPKVKVEVVVSSIPVDQVIEAAKKVLYTGHIGDGKIFVYNVDRVVKVRTGEEDTDALQDVE